MNNRLSGPGLAYAFAAYSAWGFFPLLMAQLHPSGPVEVAAHRAVWSLAACAILVLVLRRWRALLAVIRNPRALGVLGIAAALIAVNWGLMLYSVSSGQVSAAAFGYYINPLLTVGIGVFFLRERLHRAQIVAIVIASVAVVVIGLGLGRVPWVSLSLAVTFALYAVTKTKVGAKVDALTGFAVETMLLAPIAVGVLWFLAARGESTWGAAGTGHSLWLAATGPFTAAALILFAAGAARLPLSITGLIQYVAPTLNFVLAITYFHEPMPATRWAGFALVWVALVTVSVDSWRRSAGRADRKARSSGQLPVPTEPV